MNAREALDARAFFDAIASRYDRAYAPDARDSRARMERVLALLSPRSRVLDLGVGTGRELSSLLDAGHRPTGLDASKEMLARCARRARPVPLVEADFWNALPFPDASFEAALALHGTIAHPPDRDAHARLGAELLRVLGTGGLFIAEAPSRAWLERVASGGEVYDGDRAVRRTGEDTCLFEDLVNGATIAAWIPPDARWSTLLGARFDTNVTRFGDELLVVARPTR
jgi:SAM-dependent methyltransferase